MAFPSNPQNGEQYTSGGYVYQYVSATNLWKKISATSSTTANATITVANITSSTTNTAVINNATVSTANVANLSVSGSAGFDSIVLTGGISANGTYGTPGYVLKTDGSKSYWASVTSGGGVDAGAQYTWTNTQTFSNTITFSSTINGTANNALYLGGTAASGYQTTAGLSANVATLTANNSTYLGGKIQGQLNVNNAVTANAAAYLNGKTESNLNVNNSLTSNAASYLNGKTEINLNVNNSLTSNSATYVNGKEESALNVNSALTSNSAVYLGSTAASGYQTTAGLSANVAKLSANNSGYLNGKLEADLNVNSALTSNSAAYLGSTAASGYQTTAGLSANVAKLTANAAGYLNGKLEADLNVNSALTANSASYLGSISASGYQTTAGLSSNVATLTANNSGYLNSKLEADLNVNSALTSNAATYLNGKTESNLNVNSAVSSNNSSYLGGTAASGYQTTTGLSANVATLTANAAGYLNGKLEADLNVNNALTANNSAYLGGIVSSSWALKTYVDNKAGNAYSNAVAAIAFSTANDSVYLGGTAASGYQTTAGLSANVATLTANAATYLNGKTESNLNVNSALTANAASYLNGKTESNLNVNSALTSNNSAYLGGTAAASYALQTYVDNKAGNAYSNAISYSGNAAAAYANAVSYANTNFAKLSGATFTGNVVLSSTAGLVANGTVGTSNQVLISNGSSAYWAALAPVRQNYSSDGSTTTLTVSGGYTPYNLDVFVNGVKLLNGADVNVSNGSTFTLTSSYPTGTIIEAVGMVPYSGSPGSYVSKVGDTMSGTLTVGTTVVGTNYISVDNVTGNLVPSSNLTYSLGNTSNRWKDLWVGSNSITFSDTLGGPDQTLRVANQVFYIAQASSPNTYNANAGFNAGGVILQNFTITLANTSQNLTIGKAGDTGNTIINRATQVGNGSVFSTVNATSLSTNTVYTQMISANGSTGVAGQVLVSGDNTSNTYWAYNQPNTRIVTATTYTATANDSWIGFTATSSTLTLPNNAISGKQYTVACFGGGPNPKVTISVQSGVTLYANGITKVENTVVSPTSSVSGKFVFVGTTWYGSY